MPGNHYQYPLENYNDGAPFVMFRRHQARYDRYRGSAPVRADRPDDPSVRDRALTRRRSTRLQRTLNATPVRAFSAPTEDLVGLYIPAGFSVQDSANWEEVGNGIIGRYIQSLQNGTGFADVESFFTNAFNRGLSDPDATALLYSNIGQAAAAGGLGLATGALGKTSAGLGRIPGLNTLGRIVGGVGSTQASVITGLLSFGALQQASEELRKTAQTTLNPRQFMLFSNPGIRNFSLSFNFVPVSAKENDMVHDIVRWFRTAMYPELSQTGLGYIFPDAFEIRFENVGVEEGGGNRSIPLIPEVVLTSASTTYNSDSMSYFERDKRPVSIQLDLQFTELEPITKENVIQGY